MPLQHWLPDVLRAAGLTVKEYPGWRDRDRAGDPLRPRGVMWHHDASAVGDSPSVPASMAADGANGAQLWVDRYGAWTVLAAGLMWHAGKGSGCGVIRAGRGNEDSLGVETDHTVGEAWPTAQLTSLRRGTAALLRHLGADPHKALWGHKEYAPGRKPDPDGLDMAAERRIVANLMTAPKEDTVSDPLYTPITREGLPATHPLAGKDTTLAATVAWLDANLGNIREEIRVLAAKPTAVISPEDLAAAIERLDADMLAEAIIDAVARRLGRAA